ncbi:MAG: hypothetical protein CM15mP130_1090 [Verrucomicrobiota bacterium]|nr:MAG: hypothetical protein CM15mP130_1090 [Verrucomicrobiota bacterium]
MAVFSEADRSAPHVQMADRAECIGPAPVDQSYLNPEKIFQAAKIHKADAIHPGYGLLSEDADFAEACEKQGLIFIGPAPGIFVNSGLNTVPGLFAADAGVPLAPGSELSGEPGRGQSRGRRGGLPYHAKGYGWGGGIGMALCETPDELNENFDRVHDWLSPIWKCRNFLEKFFPKPGILKSKYSGTVRDEIIPWRTRLLSPASQSKSSRGNATDWGESKTLEALEESARNLEKSVSYLPAGTVEFFFMREDGIPSFF